MKQTIDTNEIKILEVTGLKYMLQEVQHWLIEMGALKEGNKFEITIKKL